MNKRILLVEDDPFLIDIYTTKFKMAGFESGTATKGEEAIQKITEEDYDLVLLDIVLPQMDGWEILKSIQEIKNKKGFNIFILSNLNQKEEIQKGLDLGADKYLVKAHFTPSEVVEEIKDFFNC